MKVKRVIASIIDHLSISILTMIVTVLIIGGFFNTNMLGGEAIPFLIMIACLSPILSSGYVVFWIIIAIIEGTRGDMSEFFPYLTVISIIIIVNTIFLSIIEVVGKGYTLGRFIFGIKVISTDGKYTLLKSFIRNLIKSTSRYMLYIPFLTIIFRKDNKSIHDILLKTDIIEVRK